MCTHAKVKKFKRQAKELRLLQKVIQKADMSLLSNCLQCVRTGADSRYVTVAASHRLQLGRSFQLGSDVALMRAAVGEALLQTVGEQAQAQRAAWKHNMSGVTEQNTYLISFSIIRSEDLMLTRLSEVHSVFSTEVIPGFVVSVHINYVL